MIDPVPQAVAAIREALDDETARAIEVALLVETDNGPQPTDPAPEPS